MAYDPEKNRLYKQARRAANPEKVKEENRRGVLLFRLRHPERVRELRRQYKERHREEIRQRERERYRVNREKESERKRQAYLADPEKWKAWHQARKARDPDSFKAIHRAIEAGRRARKRASGGSHTKQDIRHQLVRQHNRCFWCGAKLGDDYHVDHVIPLVKGGSNHPTNLVIACPSCNQRKAGKMPADFAGRLL